MQKAEIIYQGKSYRPDQLTELPSDYPERNALLEAIRIWEEKEDLTISTSGSTGTPKTIHHPHEAVVSSIEDTAAYFGLKLGQSALCALPFDKIAGRLMLYRALHIGLKLEIREPSSTPVSSEDHFDFVPLTPHQVLSCLEKDPRSLDEIGTLIIGGAAVSSELETKLQALKVRSFETYGMTETITHIAARRIYPDPNTFFEALPGVKLNSEEGRLIIEANRLQSPLHTTDIVEMDGANRFRWLGRADNVVNSGGIKLHPELLENELASIIDAPFYLVGTPDPVLGEKLIAVIEGDEKDDGLLASIRNILPSHSSPKEIIYLKELKRTNNGKIIRINPNA